MSATTCWPLLVVCCCFYKKKKLLGLESEGDERSGTWLEIDCIFLH